MDIHKPKPFHGLREFLKEYGIIVLGVLTALFLEQAVEWLHWRHEVETGAGGAAEGSARQRRHGLRSGAGAALYRKAAGRAGDRIPASRQRSAAGDRRPGRRSAEDLGATAAHGAWPWPAAASTTCRWPSGRPSATPSPILTPDGGYSTANVRLGFLSAPWTIRRAQDHGLGDAAGRLRPGARGQRGGRPHRTVCGSLLHDGTTPRECLVHSRGIQGSRFRRRDLPTVAQSLREQPSGDHAPLRRSPVGRRFRKGSELSRARDQGRAASPRTSRGREPCRTRSQSVDLER